jgi:hypothetical protein
MLASGKMPRVSTSQWDVFCWQMQDFHIAKNFLSHTGVFATIWLSTSGLDCGNCPFLIIKIEILINSHCRPANKEELFNLRHAQARNVIERIFGVLKRRFRILLIGPEYSVKFQAKIPSALCAIHNFIHRHDPKEGELPGGDPEHSNVGSNAGDEGVQQMNYAEHGVPEEVTARRDRIAQAMWESYQRILEARRQENDEDDGNEEDSEDDYLTESENDNVSVGDNNI